MSSDLAFYTCYYICQQQRVLCLNQTISSSGGCPSPGPPAEVQSKLFSGPPHQSWSHVFAANGLCSDHDAPDFPSVSGFRSEDKSIVGASSNMWQGILWSTLVSVLSWALPPGFLDGCVLKQHALPAAFGQDHVHRPWKFYCTSEATCCVLSPGGLPWLSLQLERAGHTGSVQNSQCDTWG